MELRKGVEIDFVQFLTAKVVFEQVCMKVCFRMWGESTWNRKKILSENELLMFIGRKRVLNLH